MGFQSAKWLAALIVATTFFMANGASFSTTKTISQSATMHSKLAKLEASTEGRIGVYAIDTSNSLQLGYRENGVFPTGCTSKVIGVAAILKKSMDDDALLSETLHYSKKELTEWSPITEKRLSTGMTVKQLCAAAIRYSDNTAMNLLVKKMGGLEHMTRFARTLGNPSFRQDNNWLDEAYSGGKGNVKDSSTPKDMACSLRKLAFTDVLAKPQRNMLVTWLKGNTTGASRIRAGAPKGWIVADKTGTGLVYGTTNDLGIIWPPNSAPIIIAIYYTSDDKNAVPRDDVVASATRILIDTLAQRDQRIRDQAHT